MLWVLDVYRATANLCLSGAAEVVSYNCAYTGYCGMLCDMMLYQASACYMMLCVSNPRARFPAFDIPSEKPGQLQAGMTEIPPELNDIIKDVDSNGSGGQLSSGQFWARSVSELSENQRPYSHEAHNI